MKEKTAQEAHNEKAADIIWMSEQIPVLLDELEKRIEGEVNWADVGILNEVREKLKGVLALLGDLSNGKIEADLEEARGAATKDRISKIK